MKIAFLINTPYWNAEAAYIRVMADRLRSRGHGVLVFTRKDSKLAKRMQESGVTLAHGLELSHKFNPASFFKDALKLANLIDKEKIDIIEPYHSTDHSLVALAVRFCKRKTKVLRQRRLGRFPSVNPLSDFMYRSGCSGMVTSSERMRSFLIHKFSLSADFVEVIYSPVDAELFRPDADSSRIRKEFGIGSRPLVGIVARIDENLKAQSYFLKAAGIIRKRFPDTKFMLVGKGDIEEQKAFAAESGVLNSVIFTGYRQDVPNIMAALDVGTLTSIKSEQDSRVTLEYMSSGKPVVATRVGVIPELVMDGETGLLVSPKDYKGLADNVMSLLGNSRRREAMGKAGRREVKRRFSTDATLDQLERLYERILKAA